MKNNESNTTSLVEGIKKEDSIISSHLEKISKDLEYLTEVSMEFSKDEKLENKWKLAAMVVDRLWFLISSIYTFFTFVFFILACPNFSFLIFLIFFFGHSNKGILLVLNAKINQKKTIQQNN